MCGRTNTCLSVCSLWMCVVGSKRLHVFECLCKGVCDCIVQRFSAVWDLSILSLSAHAMCV